MTGTVGLVGLHLRLHDCCFFGSDHISGYRPIEQQLVWQVAQVRNVCACVVNRTAAHERPVDDQCGLQRACII